MLEIIMVAVGLFIAWLLKQAFVGRCDANGVSQAYGAWQVLKWLVILGVGGFIALLLLASILNHANTGNW